MKKILSVMLAVTIIGSVFSFSIMNTKADSAENPNKNAAKTGIDAIRDSLNLVWSDEFGGEIGCGAKKEALATTNGFDENGNPTSDEVRKSAKWAHERLSNGQPIDRNGQIQLYVGEDGRNSWTEDGVLHIRGQREEGDGYLDPITKKRYRWTADGLSSSYFSDKDSVYHKQAFRFGMIEASVYTVNGAAKIDQDGNPVYDEDGNIQQDPATSQGLWNGFWTCGNADMSEETSSANFLEKYANWPYTGEIDICEAYNSATQFNNYNYTEGTTLKDKNGLVYNFNNGKYYVKLDENGKTLITDGSGNTCVSYDSDSKTYVVADGKTDFSISTDDNGTSYIVLNGFYNIKQKENSDGVISNYVIDSNKKTIVDADGNCYGSSTLSTAQYHYDRGTRLNADGTKETVAGATSTGKYQGLAGGFSTGNGKAGTTMTGDSGYHTYGIYWTPTQLVYYVDNMVTGIYDVSTPEYRALRECPQYAIFTFPIGGGVPGGPNPALKYSEYLVDYVRVYQADDSEYGNTGALDYKGSKGFPTLNDVDKGYDTENDCVDMSYYQPIIDAYSHINISTIGDSSQFEYKDFSPWNWYGAPLIGGRQCAYIGRSGGQLATKNKYAEGKYDVYLQGYSDDGLPDYDVKLNDSNIGSQLKLYSDRSKDKFGRTYKSMADSYLGTAEIKNGSHNLRINIAPTADSTSTNNGALNVLITVGKSKNQTTVTIDGDTPVATTVPTSSTTKPKLPDGFYDAYTATLSGGASKNTNHTGYLGKGFVDNFGAVGSAVTFNVNVENAGDYTLDFRYANSCGDGKDSYPTLYIDDQKIQELTFTENGKSSLSNYAGWDSWSNNTEYVATLSAGSHKIKLQYDRATYSANLDGLTLTAVGGDTPTNPTNPSSETSSSSTTTTKQSSVGEVTKLTFSKDTFTISDNTAGFDFGSSDGISNIYGNISADKGVTLISKVQLDPGVYDLTIYARARAVRPKFDIEVNGTVVGEGVDTSNTVLGTNNDAPVDLKSVTIPKTTYVTIKITGSTGIATSWLYLNSLMFTKTADVPTESKLATMVEGASIRLGSVNGIRFYTKVDIDKIAQLRKDGATVEMGTLIGPKDLIGDDELTLDLVKENRCVNVEFKAQEYYSKDGFTGIVGSIVNIKENNTSFSDENGNIAREFVGRGYVKVTKDGNTTITYADYANGNIANNSRSLAYVSYKFANENPELLKQYSETIQEKVNKWASLYQA